MNEPPETIADALASLCVRQPAAAAIHVPGRRTLTYGDLGAQIGYVRDRFNGWGIGAGAIVCAALASRPELAVALATLPGACTFAPLDPSLSREAFDALLRRTKATAIVAVTGDEHPIRFAARELGIAEIELKPERDAAAGLFSLALGRAAAASRSSIDARFAYVVASSGTTGRRKLVPLEHRALLRYAQSMGNWLELAPGDTSIHLTPLHLGNGLVANLVCSLAAGASIVCLPEADVAGFYESIETFEPTFVIAGFALFQAILRCAPEFGSAIARNRFRFMRAGSGRLAPDDAERLEQVFGAPMLVGLSSSETLQIAHEPLPPRRRKRGSVGLPVANEVALLSDTGEIRGGEGHGEIVVRGPVVFGGYLDDPELTAASFTDSWFRTGDLGRIDEDGYVYVTGRIKEIINRGGEKISPLEIDLAIESLPGVREAAAFGVAHPSLGEEVVAAVVREKNATIDEASVLEHLRAHGDIRRAPRRVHFVDRLPRTVSGKLRRNALPELLALAEGTGGRRSAQIAEAADRSSPLEDEVAQIWGSILAATPFGRDDDFFLAGGDSLRGLQLIANLKSRYGVALSLQELFGRAATVAGMASTIESLRAKARELRQHSGPWTFEDADVGIRAQGVQGPMPLSRTQLRMWLMERLDKGSCAYNLMSAFRLHGPVDVVALRDAIAVIIERHEALRTRFVVVDDEPRQIVDPTAIVDFAQLDLAAAPTTDRELALTGLMKTEVQRPFDFERGPLIRFRLVRLAHHDHALVQVWHHIVADGWSAEVIESELAAIYTERVSGKRAALAAPGVRYADYAMWQRKWLAGGEGDRQLAFWREELEGLETLDLPADRPRPAAQTYRGARLIIPVPAALVARIAALGRAERATPFMTWLAAFLVLLHRYSGEEDIAVGTQSAGRARAELRGVVGAFLNTLVVRCDLSGQPTFRELLGRVRERALRVFANLDLPFEKLVEELAPRRDLSRNPLFQVSCVWQYPTAATLDLAGLDVSRIQVPGYSAKLDLTLMLRETGQRLETIWEYSEDLFDSRTIERMAGHLERLLEAIVADPERRIAELPLLGTEELRLILSQWNRTAADYRQDRCIHQLVEEQCARTPSAFAAVCVDRRLTYGELDARANQLARYLIAHGVGPEVRVGLCFEPSLELLIGLFGIFKAGGAYVPLDPSYPSERLALMLKDARAPLVLTTERLRSLLPMHDGRVLSIDGDSEAIGTQSDAPLRRDATSRSLAYVIYTSGSTGTPKGVMIEQCSLVNYVLWLQREFPLTVADRMLAITPTSFDISVLELFWPLVAGAQVEVAPPGAHRYADELIDLVRRREITVAQMVPSMLGTIVDSAGFAGLASLRRVFTAGEALDATLVRRFHARSAAELVNGYGPTETCVYSTFWRCPRDVDRSVIPIGRPIANTRVWILDRHRAPVPVGVPGELYIGGDGVARGYLGRFDLTAERFLPHPFDQDGARMYRTGDRVRYLADGDIQFLGRVDRQVKLRGFRIEPGEIEAILRQHPNVRGAFVSLWTGQPGDVTLVAYVAANDPPADLGQRLRETLRANLPQNVVPTRVVVLDKLPLLPNGKVDPRALPSPSSVPDEVARAYLAPRNPLEQRIAGVWRAALKIEKLGIHDNFFDVGGHSLLAAQVVARLHNELAITVPLRAMFETPTIAGLANYAGGVERTPAIGAVERVARNASRRRMGGGR